MQIHLAAANVHDVINHSAGVCAHVPRKLKILKSRTRMKFYLDISFFDTTVVNLVNNIRHAASEALSADDEHFLSNDSRAAEF